MDYKKYLNENKVKTMFVKELLRIIDSSRNPTEARVDAEALIYDYRMNDLLSMDEIMKLIDGLDQIKRG